MFIDSHCHLDRLKLTEECPSIDAAIRQAQACGVERFLCVAISLETLPDVESLANAHDCIDYSVGVHPLEKDKAGLKAANLLEHADKSGVCAIGETGLDYYYDKESIEEQKRSFIEHIGVARAVNKPLIVHTRDAREDTLQILRDEKAEQVGGVLHCFTESLDMAEAAIELGFYISFSGIITFNSASSLRDVVKRLPIHKILIETDSPYLAPVPHRGKPCYPAYVTEVAKKIAELKDLSIEEVADITKRNYHRLFKKNV